MPCGRAAEHIGVQCSYLKKAGAAPVTDFRKRASLIFRNPLPPHLCSPKFFRGLCPRPTVVIRRFRGAKFGRRSRIRSRTYLIDYFAFSVPNINITFRIYYFPERALRAPGGGQGGLTTTRRPARPALLLRMRHAPMHGVQSSVILKDFEESS